MTDDRDMGQPDILPADEEQDGEIGLGLLVGLIMTALGWAALIAFGLWVAR